MPRSLVSSDIGASHQAALDEAATELRVLRDLFANAPVGLHSLDAAGRIVEINETARRWLGRRRQDVVGKLTFLDVLEPGDHDRFRRALARVQSGEALNDIELALRRSDASSMPVLISANAQLAPDGAFQVARIAALDLTERKRIEEQLGATERRYEQLVTTIDGVVWELDVASFAFEFVSPQAERLLGYPLSEWFETPSAWVKYLHEDDRDEAIAFCVEETTAKRDHRFEYRMVAADGRVVWLQDIVHVIVEDDQPVKLRGVMVDISERKEAEAERERSSAELTRFFELTPELLCVTGFDGYFKRVNAAFEQTLGYSKEELLSRPSLDFVHPDDRVGRPLAPTLAARGELRSSHEERRIDRNGNVHWIQWTGQIVPGEQLVYAAGRDITESRHHAKEEAALRRLATLVAEAAPPEIVFAAVAEELSALFAAPLTSVMRFDPDDTALVLGGLRLGAPRMGLRYALNGDSLAARVRATGQPTLFDDYATASGELASEGRAIGARVSAGAPIFVGGRLWGVMICAWDAPQHAAPGIENRLARFAELVAAAIANAESQAEVAASRKRIVIAADEARRRIQRNLHDSTQQRLVAIALELRTAKAMAEEHAALAAKLDSLGELLAETIAELQDISRGLHPALLSSGGLEPALAALARRSPIPVTLSMDLPTRLPDALEIAAYYTASEALTNATKHARATTVHIELSANADQVTMVVSDDGVGGAEPGRGSGLTGLRDRVEALGGSLSVQSAAAEGTRLDIRLPLFAPLSQP